MDAFKRLQADGFKHWKPDVEGLVDRPRAFTVEELKSMTSSSQITQVTCERGWFYIVVSSGGRGGPHRNWEVEASDKPAF